MSIELNVRDWDDEEYDDCGNTAVAILKVGRIKIPLCMDCVNELQESVYDFVVHSTVISVNILRNHNGAGSMVGLVVRMKTY